MSSRIGQTVATQLRVLRQRKDMSQEELAKALSTSQNAISRLENPTYGKASISTLKAVASFFDVALVVRFAPYSELVKWTNSLDSDSINIPVFDDDLGFVEHRLAARARAVWSESQYQKSLFDALDLRPTGISSNSTLRDIASPSKQAEGNVSVPAYHDPKQQPITERASATNMIEITELRRRVKKTRRTYRRALGKPA